MRNFVSFVIVGVALTVACATAHSPMRCGDNERMGNCGNICEEKCDNPNQMERCAATDCSGDGCQCKPGFLRNQETNKCVRQNECPMEKCRAHEVLGACGKACEGTCENPWRPRRCMTMKCARPGCQCDLSRGYVRDQRTGKCVRNQDNHECAKRLECPANSERRVCGGQCEATCSRPEDIRCKLDPTNCVVACQCKKDHVRNEMTGECVRRRDCPRRPRPSY